MNKGLIVSGMSGAGKNYVYNLVSPKYNIKLAKNYLRDQKDQMKKMELMGFYNKI